MRDKDTKIPMPLRGVDKTQAAGSQRPDTTFDAENVRSVDTDKRVRITQRPGTEKAYPYAMDGPVRVVATIVQEGKSVTYEATEDEIEANGDGRTKHTEVWKKLTSQKKDVRNVVVAPLSGNVYSLSGNVIEKRNGDGVVQWAYSVALANKAFRLSPMALGPDEAVFVAVDGGSAGAKGAAIYRIRQKPIDDFSNVEPVLEWTWVVDGWVRELAVDGSELKALVQFNEKRRSYVWTFGNVTNAVPQLKDEYQVPYPSTCMAVTSEGASITGHPVYALRNTTPGKPGIGLPLVSWTPFELTDFNERAWGWWDAASAVTTYADGAEVQLWQDDLNTGRDWGQGIPEQGSGVIRPGPTLNLKSSIGQPTLQFNGKQGLFSPAGGGIFADKDSCMSALPNHGEGAFCVIIVCRPATATIPGELDADGKPVDERRFLLHQFHQRKYTGTSNAYFDSGATRAFCSGIIVNSTSVNVPATNDDLYCWGRSDSIAGISAPGYARPYSSSSGYRFTGTHDADGYDAGAWTAGTSDFDWPGMPLQRGAGTFGWPKEGQFADVDSTAGGSEGWCVLTYMHDGGLNEYFSLTGTGANTVITLDDTSQIKHIPIGATCTIIVNGQADTGTKTSSNVITTAIGLYLGAVTAQAVFARNYHSRSVWRINGKPIDRWESLPMGFRGPSSLSSPTVADRTIDNNVDLQQTGLGIPWALGNVKPFFGEVKSMFVLGNRQTAADGIEIGGEVHYEYPTVLTHPKYATSAHGNDTATPDQAWTGTANNYLSTEMEKLEGFFMHECGIQDKLQSTSAAYPHPHYPGNGAGTALQKAHDVPLTSEYPSSGQAWIPRLRKPDAMLVKHDASGRMLWCLLASNVYGTDTGGDLFRVDLNGTPGGTGITDAPATSGVAIGLDGDVFVVGPGSTASGGSQFCMGRIDDDPVLGAAPDLNSVGWYSVGTPFPPDTNLANFTADETIRCKTDVFGNFYVPFPPGTQYLLADAIDAVRAYDREGNLLFRLTTLDHGTDAYQNAYAVAFPSSVPDYNID